MDIEDVVDPESIGLREHHLPEHELPVAIGRLRIPECDKHHGSRLEIAAIDKEIRVSRGRRCGT